MSAQPIDDGGPAFPITLMATIRNCEGSSSVVDQSFPGMSLRDYFAAAALQAILRFDEDGNISVWNYPGAAEEAYAFADAMLAERSKEAPNA